MALFDERFDGWQAADFAAFETRKWTSNRYNLERGRVRLRLIDLLEQVRAQTGSCLQGLDIWTSPDHPKLSNGHKVRWQAAAFCCPQQLRRAIERVDPSLDADDVRNSHAHFGVVVEQELMRILLVLPAGAKLDQGRFAAAQDLWETLAKTLDVALLRDDRGVRIERQFSSDEVMAGGASLQLLVDWASAVVPVLEAVQWSPQCDPEGVGAAVIKAMQDAAQPNVKPVARRPVKPRTIAPAGSKSVEPKPPPPPSRPRSSQRGKTARASEAGAQARGTAGSGSRSHPGRGQSARAGHRSSHGSANRQGDGRNERNKRRPVGPRGPYQLGPTRGEKAKQTGDVTIGAKVSLRSGLFAGKEGEVLTIKKGIAEVAVGPMTVQMAVAELAVV